MTSREQFEQWFSKSYSCTAKLFRLNENGEYENLTVRVSWWAWQASRECLVIRLIPDINPTMFKDDVIFGYQKAKKEAIQVLTTAGLTVKSE